MASAQGTTATTTATSPLPHRHHHRKSDPFNNIPPLRPSSSESSLACEECEKEATPDSLWQRIIISPLLFTSFLISLCLVERRDRAWRVSQQYSRANSSIWSRFSPSNWIDPEPYQDPANATWQKDDAGQNATRNPATDGSAHKPVNKKSWFTRKKHRKMAKVQLEDAWEGIGRVEVWIVSAGVIVVGGTVWGVQRLFGWGIW
ncbi:hypothetical protein NA57DRAFT_62121 [Rhizodiscina lignyota]|uniref:Uncharacterized protein n=1 Tax=Rhizodiscina lignyota TaxID=1504668 RepID=A0A9P4I0P4_9PEZI|nr:hypothetical protein NA57DRAFT_62121 [Rhizodiscina lignyota]